MNAHSPRLRDLVAFLLQGARRARPDRRRGTARVRVIHRFTDGTTRLSPMIKAMAALLGMVLALAAPALPAHAGKATVLLVLQPVKANGKKWDLGRGADPVLCVETGCYVSTGLSEAARFIAGDVTFRGLKRKADACNNRLTCAFRAITLPDDGPGFIQPIDIDLLRHDRPAPRHVMADETCRLEDTRLSCDGGIFTPDYSLWIVPEALARKGGAAALDYALFRGIRASRRAFMERFVTQARESLPELVGDFLRLVLAEHVARACRRSADVIVEALAIADIAPARDPQAQQLVRDVLDGTKHESLMRRMRLHEPLFWRLHALIARLHTLAAADRALPVPGRDTIRLRNGGGQSTLEIGWAVRSRARNLVRPCQGDDAVPTEALLID